MILYALKKEYKQAVDLALKCDDHFKAYEYAEKETN